MLWYLIRFKIKYFLRFLINGRSSPKKMCSKMNEPNQSKKTHQIMLSFFLKLEKWTMPVCSVHASYGLCVSFFSCVLSFVWKYLFLEFMHCRPFLSPNFWDRNEQKKNKTHACNVLWCLFGAYKHYLTRVYCAVIC